MTQTIFGTKQLMTEAYLGKSRVAVTKINLLPMTVSHIREDVKDGYQAAQVVFGRPKKRVTRSLAGHLKKSQAKGSQIREIDYADDQEVGGVIQGSSLVTPGSVVTIQGVAKGKGFAGVMKRWNFAGGPRTHGQSDRARAPGSIGQGTTPGRVHKGKKMAGRMGGQTVTIQNALCVAVSDDSIWVTGPIPGPVNTILKIIITGTQDVPSLSFLNGYAKPEIAEPKSEEAPVESAEDTVTEAATAETVETIDKETK